MNKFFKKLSVVSLMLFIAVIGILLLGSERALAQQGQNITKITTDVAFHRGAKVNNNGDVIWITYGSNTQTLNFYDNSNGTISSVFVVTNQNGEYHIFGEYNINDLGDMVWEVLDSYPNTQYGYLNRYSVYYKAYDSETVTFLGNSVMGNYSNNRTARATMPRINNNRLIVIKGLMSTISQGAEDLAITQIPGTLLTPITYNISNINAKIQFVKINDNDVVAYNYASNAPLWTFGSGKVIKYDPISHTYYPLYQYISTSPASIGDLTNNNTYFYSYFGIKMVKCTLTGCQRETSISPGITWMSANSNDHVIWYYPANVIQYYDGLVARSVSDPNITAYNARIGGNNEVVWNERQNNVDRLIWFDTNTNSRRALFETDPGLWIDSIEISDSGNIIFSVTNGQENDLYLIECFYNNPPTANAGSDYIGYEGQQMTLDGSGSIDPDGLSDIVSYRWDFGDGETGDGMIVTHTYGDDGIYFATLTVTDTQGATATDTTIVTINDIAPIVNAGLDSTTEEGTSFSEQGSFVDPGTDIWMATVDYGDGSGILELTLSGKSFTLSHIYADNGVYAVVVTITDETGAFGSDIVTVTVNNVAPTMEAIVPIVSNLPGVMVSASTNFIDPGVLDTHTASWDWGDGNTSLGIVIEANGQDTVTGSHIYSIPGTYLVTLTVFDGSSSGEATAIAHVLTVTEAIQDLINLIETYNLQRGIENSLDAKLQAALDSLNDLNERNDGAAVNSLQAFINAVEAQRGNKITDEQADEMEAQAEAIITYLSS